MTLMILKKGQRIYPEATIMVLGSRSQKDWLILTKDSNVVNLQLKTVKV
jgi:hypothetical protein